MARPKRGRRILSNPNIIYFKPRGVPLIELEEVKIRMDEYEAIKLKDFEGFDQIICAKKMNVSQPTFNRILTLARKKIADAIINGKAVQIEKEGEKNESN